MEPYPFADRPAEGRDLHARPPRLLAEPADGQRRRRLRGRRPLPLRDDRLRAREGRDRRRGRDDVPPHAQRRRRPQLFLEGAAAPLSARRRSKHHGKQRDQGSRRHRRHGLHASSASTGTRAPTISWSTPPTHAYESAGMEPNDVDAYWLGTMGQLSGLTLSEPLKIHYKPVTHVENFCATGSRGAAPGLLRGRVRRLRHRDGDRRREAQGLGLLGPRRRRARRTTARSAT